MPYWEGVPRIQHWRSSPAPIAAGNGTIHNSFFVAPLDIDGEPFPANLQANSFAVAISGSLTATSVSQQLSSSWKLGLYTRSGSTLNLVNSASGTFGNTNASTVNTSRWNGVRFIQLVSSQWSAVPIFLQGARYYVAMQLLSAVTTGAMSFMNAATAQTAYSGIIGAAAPNATNAPFSPFRGLFNATTANVPTTIQASQVTGTGTAMSFFPYIRLDEDFSNY